MRRMDETSTHTTGFWYGSNFTGPLPVGSARAADYTEFQLVRGENIRKGTAIMAAGFAGLGLVWLLWTTRQK